MKKIYFTPGPSQLYFTAEEHIKNALNESVPSLSHRSKAYESIHQAAVENIKQLLQLPEGYHVLFTGSATEIWERTIQNLVSKESFHFVNGSFSSRFHEIAENYQINALAKKVDEGQVVKPEEVLIPESTELIAMTQNETSTGAAQPLDDIKQIRSAFEKQIIALDVVSSAPYIPVDYSLVDTAYFSVQKCFGLPAGLGVWIVNEKCIAKAEEKMNENKIIGSYHSLPSMLEKSVKNQTSETPNVLGIYLLGKVAGDMLTKGIEQIRRETEYKAAVLYQAFEECSQLSPFIKEEKYRSKTTLVAETKCDSSEVINLLNQKGIVLGSGYGKFKKEHIRIANFPTHSKESVELIADELVRNFK
ncbi:aminotransferase class V-fold PLP-dependent enzyme [Fulvivirga maritima]|uniref:aminotransferase class V-fold PLP-dependent enzyme n=1 Tax=Fulvivirga maritima TaxID=2904247 RepID=UPI001F182D61|nr:aminotransferase class V-fold PLP-dependent enzyme [Fulvivirga maritima]UII25616.1 aminotransferase class V-fold PLP-dependent enzyme [Fulvivirga maritima]